MEPDANLAFPHPIAIPLTMATHILSIHNTTLRGQALNKTTGGRRASLVVRASSSSSSSSSDKQVVLVCQNKECKQRGARRTLKCALALAETLNVQVEEQDCFGDCAMGPNISVNEKMFYGCKTPDKIAAAFATVEGIDADATVMVRVV